jgi:signal transduction histidine kinase
VLPTDGFVPRLTELAELQVLRIIQESLTNVRKHASATQVTVTLGKHTDRVDVRISDDGAGFDPDYVGPRQFPRFGLTTMRERAESVNGTFEIQSSAGHGTTVHVSIPNGKQTRIPGGGNREGTYR